MTQLRNIILRHEGRKNGPITRVINPSDIAKLTKPFVFLDYVNINNGKAPGFGFHPHSGIATLTHPLTFDTQHEISSGQVDIVHRGGIEWVIAGKGLWHKAKALSDSSVIQGFQLWLALPPSDELSDPSAQFIQPKDVQESGPVRVLLGTYNGIVSNVDTPYDANYFWVQLKSGESWNYSPPEAHQSAWIFVQQGTLYVNGESVSNELAVFNEGNGTLNFHANEECKFLLGSASPYNYDLVLGNYSIHTSQQALAKGELNIKKIGQILVN